MDNPFEVLEARLATIQAQLDKIINQQNTPQELNENEWGDISLAMDVTKLKRSTIYSHVHQKKLPYHKKLGKLYFSKDELLKWIKGQEPDNEQGVVPKPLFPNHKRYKK